VNGRVTAVSWPFWDARFPAPRYEIVCRPLRVPNTGSFQ